MQHETMRRLSYDIDQLSHKLQQLKADKVDIVKNISKILRAYDQEQAEIKNKEKNMRSLEQDHNHIETNIQTHIREIEVKTAELNALQKIHLSPASGDLYNGTHQVGFRTTQEHALARTQPSPEQPYEPYGAMRKRLQQRTPPDLKQGVFRKQQPAAHQEGQDPLSHFFEALSSIFQNKHGIWST